MAENTKIEWAKHTANLWHGCSEVNAGCDNCYARILSERWGRDIWGADKPRWLIKSVWSQLDKFQEMAKAAGTIDPIFVGSMMDIFEKPMPLIDAKGNHVYFDNTDKNLHTGHLRQRFFEKISNGDYPNLLFLLLTKRPGNINKYIPVAWLENPPVNVIYGCSIPDQKAADLCLPKFFKVKGRKFLSMEPLIGPVEPLFRQHNPPGFWFPNRRYIPTGLLIKGLGDICQVIVGGESGNDLKKLRIMNPFWVRDIRDNCLAAGVPFFFKQWGEYYTKDVLVSTGEPVFRSFSYIGQWIDKAHTWINGGRCISIDGIECKNGLDFNRCKYPVTVMHHVGKKAAGHVLDGKVYQQLPKPLL